MSMTLQGIKQGVAITPVSLASASATPLVIDTAGYDELQISVLASSVAATAEFSVLTLSSADVTAATSFATVSGYVGGTDFTIAETDGANPYVVQLNVDLRGKKRYFKVNLTTAATQLVGATYSLGRAVAAPITASTAGVNTLVNP